ncbi:hypothetical protein MHYP_G00051460 [Metynnis hypsauchen]
MAADFRRICILSPLQINGSPLERVKSSWCVLVYTSLMTPQHPPSNLSTIYRGTKGNILSSCLTVSYLICTISDHRNLQQLVRRAEEISGVSLPTINISYQKVFTHKAASMVMDPSLSSHVLPSGRRY